MASDRITAAVRLADEFDWVIAALYGCAAPGVCRCFRGAACPMPGKHPIGEEWQSRATSDSSVLLETLKPEDNIGLVLGPASGVIDVEYDSPEGQKRVEEALANVEFVTPTYKSGRSVHRLFKWSAEFPSVAKRTIGGVEFRFGGGAAGQSVIPPSMHHTGVEYQWLPGLSPWECGGIAELPEPLMAIIVNDMAGGGVSASKSKFNWRRSIITGIPEGQRNEILWRMACSLFNGSYSIDNENDISDVIHIISAVNATKCQPPLSAVEVTSIVRSAENNQRKHATREVCQAAGITATENTDGHVEFTPDKLQLTVVTADPVEYQLYCQDWVPLTADKRGIVTLSSEQFRCANRVADAVLEQTRTVLLDRFPTEWEVVWDGRKPGRNSPPVIGVKATLLAQAVEAGRIVAPARSANRIVVLCGFVYEQILMAKAADDTDKPLASGAPKRMTDGSVWFRWEWVWSQIRRAQMVHEKEKRIVQRRLEELFGGWPTRRREVSGGKLVYCVWGLRELALLEEFQAGDGDGDEVHELQEGGA